jgi:hypothetical protein
MNDPLTNIFGCCRPRRDKANIGYNRAEPHTPIHEASFNFPYMMNYMHDYIFYVCRDDY